MFGATCAILSPSISTSPFGRSPIFGSIEITEPPRSNNRSATLSSSLKLSDGGGLHLAAHGGGIEPGVLALDQSITQIKDVEQPEAHGSATAGHAGELAHDVPGGDRLVDYVVSALKPSDAAQVDVGNGLQDTAVRLGDRPLASEWRAGMGHIVPHDGVGVGRQRRLDVVGVLRGEVAINDVQTSRNQRSDPSLACAQQT